MKDKDKDIHQNRTKAFCKDKEFYAEEDLGQYTVFGTETGFAYKSYMEQQEAEEYAAELNRNKANLEEFLDSIS